MTYLLVLAAAGAALVSVVLEVSEHLPQPVSIAPATIPNNTTSVNILFIVSLICTRSAKRASRVLSAAGSATAGVSHPGRLGVAQFDGGFQRGCVFQNWRGNFVSPDCLEAQLVPIGYAMRN